MRVWKNTTNDGIQGKLIYSILNDFKIKIKGRLFFFILSHYSIYIRLLNFTEERTLTQTRTPSHGFG